MYGPGDNYDLLNSHVLPAMIRKFHEAKVGSYDVILWGDGSPLREFLHVDDCALAVILLMEKYDYKDIGELINIGSGEELTIKALAEIVAQVVGYNGKIKWNTKQPNGTPRKLLDSTKLFSLGWKPKISLYEGIERSYKEILQLQWRKNNNGC
jgi:GDP-L-fucose synthase